MPTDRDRAPSPAVGPPDRAAHDVPIMVVDIFGRRYNIRGDHDPSTIRALARYVDQRMRQVAEQVAPGDVVGVAVMAALNIADDYYKTRRALEQRENEITEQTRILAEKLVQAIESVD